MCKYFKLLLLLLEFCFYPCFLVQSHYSSLKFFLSAFIVRPRCESVIGLDSRIKSSESEITNRKLKLLVDINFQSYKVVFDF